MHICNPKQVHLYYILFLRCYLYLLAITLTALTNAFELLDLTHTDELACHHALGNIIKTGISLNFVIDVLLYLIGHQVSILTI